MKNEQNVVPLREEVQQFRQQNPQVNEVDLISLDIPGNYFGKRYPISQLEKLTETGIKLPASMYLMCTQGYPVDAMGYGMEDGDPDTNMFLVPGSLKVVNWEPETRGQMLITSGVGEAPLIWEPRVILHNVLREFHRQGHNPTVAFELEFYLISKERNNGLIQPPKDPMTGRIDRSAVLAMDRVSSYGDCLREVITSCNEQGIGTGPISAELGLGQYEINLDHHTDVMLAADQCAAFKRIVKGVALKHGIQATFMAKPYLDQPGNGLHLHLGVYDTDGENVMHKNGKRALLHAVAGCLELMPASMAFFAANRNAYRRLQPNNFTAVGANWGYENRSVAVRVPLSDPANTRLEHRVAGADANPYLALAAILTSVKHGLENELDPGTPCVDNADEAGGLPTELISALDQLGESAPLRKELGGKFVDIYCAQKKSDLAEFENMIPAREYEWYL